MASGASLEVQLGPQVVLLKGQLREPSRGESLVYLIGTAHISKESCAEVRNLIRKVQPQAVFLELCVERRPLLTASLKELQNQDMTLREILSVIREPDCNFASLFLHLFISKIAKELGVLPGEEFRVAHHEAHGCGAVTVLGDRPIAITLERWWRSMSTWEYMTFMCSGLLGVFWGPSEKEMKEFLEELKDKDLLEVLLEEIGSICPSFVHALVDERDLYMAAGLHRVAQKSPLVVAVVGRAHVAGIVKNWGRTDIDIRLLTQMPPRSPLISLTAKKWLLVGVAVSGACFVAFRVLRRV